MKNQFIDYAIRELSREANRIENKKQREAIQAKIKKLSAEFEKADDSGAKNPPGKAVVRDKNGKVVGLQG